MKNVAAVFFCFWLICGWLSGCEKPEQITSVGRVRLPAGVAGTWQARDNVWRIVLTESGQVDSAVIPLGEVEIKPNKTTKVQMDDGRYSTYKAGDCTIEYDAALRELVVAIEMEEIQILFMDNRITGNTKDVFIGTVSEDGKVWETDWLNWFDLGERFPMDPEGVGAVLIFDKVEEESEQGPIQ